MKIFLAHCRQKTHSNPRIMHRDFRQWWPDYRHQYITHCITPNMPHYVSSNGLGYFTCSVVSITNGSFLNFSKINAHSFFFYHYLSAGFNIDTLHLDVLNAKLNSLFLKIIRWCWCLIFKSYLRIFECFWIYGIR